MGQVITKLLNNLIIFRPYEDEDDPDDDYIFYIYDEYINKVYEYIPEENLEEMGLELITIKELYTNNIRKVASLISPVTKQIKAHSISYNTFGFFLLIKLSINTIMAYSYAKGFIKLTEDIAKNEFKVAYNFSEYLLEYFDYGRGIKDTVIGDLKDEKTFIDYYSKNLIK